MEKQEKKTRISILALSICYLLSCPVMAYGATKAGAEIATDYARKTREESTVKSQISEKYIPTTDRTRSIEANLSIDPRGTSSISRTISAGKSVTYSITATSSSIGVSLYSESKSDSFSVLFDGYQVDSSNGRLSCDFDTEPNKKYTLYIDNNMDHSIHVTGAIQN